MFLKKLVVKNIVYFYIALECRILICSVLSAIYSRVSFIAYNLSRCFMSVNAVIDIKLGRASRPIFTRKGTRILMDARIDRADADEQDWEIEGLNDEEIAIETLEERVELSLLVPTWTCNSNCSRNDPGL